MSSLANAVRKLAFKGSRERTIRTNNHTGPQILSTPDRSTHPKLREATLDDYAQITALQSRNGLGCRARDNWRSFWQDNPVYRRRNGTWPIGWLLQKIDGKVVGWLGNMPSAYYFKGKELLSASASPWVVDAEYRGYSILLLDYFTRQKNVDVLINSSAGPKAGPPCKLFGYSKVPIGQWDKSAYWIANYRGFAEIALRMKALPRVQALTYPLAAVLFLKDYIRTARRAAYPSSTCVELCSEFDTRFEGFWLELKEQRQDTLLSVRNLETLEWHFRDMLSERRLWILTCLEGSRLVAYAILDRPDDAHELRRIRLVDFQTLGGYEQMLSPLLWRALQKCCSEGIHLMEVTGCWLDRAELPRVVPSHFRNLSSWTFYYKAIDEEFAKALKDPKVWQPSCFDGDACV
jgi:hypothetical protein